jgi:hypothetical protein
MRMNQPGTTKNIRLEARLTVKRLKISVRAAEVVSMTRNVIAIQIQREQAAESIQAGDFAELEVALPPLYGVPQRYLYCRCHVNNVQSCADEVIRLALGVEGMQFRDENGTMRAPDTNFLVM